MIRKKVLVIEDDQVIRDTMSVLLESEGYIVECAANGDEGIEVLRRTEPLPDLILLDMAMPVKYGFQFRKEQERDVKLALVPVLLMTAERNIEARAAEVGAKGFIKKPFSIDHVVMMVGRFA